MRICFIALFFLFFGLTFVQAQRFGYIASEYILNKMPEYREAQSEINLLAQGWEKVIQVMSKGIEAMYADLEAERVLLTEEMRNERLAAIRAKEDELKQYQNKGVGFEGLFFRKKKELVKPV